MIFSVYRSCTPGLPELPSMKDEYNRGTTLPDRQFQITCLLNDGMAVPGAMEIPQEFLSRSSIW